MDIEKLIEQLKRNTDCWTDKVHGYAGLRLAAANALSTLQAENELLREKVEDARLEGYAKGIGEMCAELEQVKRELEEARGAICTHCLDVPCQGESCYWWRSQRED